MKLALAIIAALPEIIKLIQALQYQLEQDSQNRKIKDDLAQIRKAFESGDEELLRAVFANRVRS